jgi:cytochrome c oxidase subunit 2
MLPAVHPCARVLRRALLLVPAVVGVGLLVAGPALGDAFTPQSGGSPNADDIDTLFKMVLVVAVIVLVGVEGLLLYTVIRFRKRKGMVAAQIHGNTHLELGWTIGAAVIVVVLIVLSFSKLSAINDPPASGPNVLVPAAGGALVASYNQPPPPGGKGITIDVNGQQYVWRYTYPNGAFSYEEMVAPVDTTVILRIRSQDVAHSWWIPELGGKFDALPGYTNKTWFKIPADKAGTIFRGQCAELCGNGHANMYARVRAVTPEQFKAYMACQKLLIAQAQRATTPAGRNQPTPPEPGACAAVPSSG